MKYLKSFESINFGDKHFGIAVFDYIPWAKYPKSITQLPKYDDKMRRFLLSWLSDTPYAPMAYVWMNYEGNWLFRWDAHLIQNRDSSEYMLVNQNTNELLFNGRSIDIEDWEDIEKIKLTLFLGKRDKSTEYFNILQDAIEVYEVFEDYDLSSDDNNSYTDKDYRMMKLKSAIEEEEVYLDITDEMLIEFIKNYTGDVEFYKSLRRFLEKNGNLTYRQLQAMKKKPNIEMYNLDPNKICIFLNPNIYKHIGERLVNMGYKSQKCRSSYGHEIMLYR
jgi:hypothetical protein